MYERGGGEAGAETEEGIIGIPDMQEVASREFSEIAGKLSEDFAFRLKVKEETTSPAQDEETEEEFSFSNAFGDRSPVAAEDVFEDGWIRPVFPLFNRELLLSGEDLRPPVKKLFIKEEEEEEEEEAEGPYCEWNGKKAVVKEAVATTKSNSTGFSKLWRLRERTMRSNSDGKDAFVFLSGAGDDAKPEKTTKKKKKVVMKKKKSAKVATSSFSAHYATSRAKKEEDKRVSYLPYRVGFFANVSGGMSRNVHPF